MTIAISSEHLRSKRSQADLVEMFRRIRIIFKIISFVWYDSLDTTHDFLNFNDKVNSSQHICGYSWLYFKNLIMSFFAEYQNACMELVHLLDYRLLQPLIATNSSLGF